MTQNIPTGANPVVLPPFRAWLASNIPAVYDNTMSYYDELTSLIKYLESVILPAVNENSQNVTELANLYKELKEFVDNYFENLDVQEEINNKLDVMSEDGTLTRLISNYLNSSIKIYTPKLLLNGDLSVIEFHEGDETKLAIIDFGNYDASYYNDLTYKLINKGYTHFNYAFISHYDNDHIGSLSQLLNDARFDFSDAIFYLPPTPDYTQWTGNPSGIETIENDIKTALTSANIEYIQPTNSTELNINASTKIHFYNANVEDFSSYYSILNENSRTEYNNFSMCVEITHNNTRTLFTGDICAGAQKVIMEQGVQVPDVIKIPHHGRGAFRLSSDMAAGLYQPFIELIYKPQLAFCSGEYYPLSYVYQSLAKLYKTYISHNGDININIQNGNIEATSTGNVYNPAVSINNFLISNFINEQYNLGTENVLQRITEATDFDTITTAGTYYCISSTVVSNMVNKPDGLTEQFKLIVNKIDSERMVQMILERNTPYIYIRYGRNNGSNINSWRRWNTYTDDGIGSNVTTNLDNYTNVGIYHCDSGETASTILNIPVGLNKPFKLTVERMTGSENYRIQKLETASQVPSIYIRGKTSEGWGAWKEVTLA